MSSQSKSKELIVSTKAKEKLPVKYNESSVLDLVDNEIFLENRNEVTQLGQFWFHFAPNSLQIAESIVSRYVDPCSALDILDCSGFIWHPFISSILSMPAAPILALLSFIFISFGLKKSVRKRAKNKL